LFRPDRFGHANLFVADVGRSLRFYRDVCGIEEVFTEPGIKAGFLSNGATHHDIGLMQVSDRPLYGKDGKVQNTMVRGRLPGLNHLAFHVAREQDLIEAYRNAAAHGITVERAMDHGMSRSLYLLDPDGNAIEFYFDTITDWRRFYAENQGALISAVWNPATDPPVAPSPPGEHRIGRVKAASVHPLEICGATLFVDALPASVDFYTRIGGLDRQVPEGDAVALLALPGSASPCLALIQATRQDRPGLHALWFLAEPADDRGAGSGEPAITWRKAPEGARGFLHDPTGIGLAFFTGAGALPAAPVRDEVLVPAGPIGSA
jgi:catechol 2,3-dioxygenase